MTTVRLPALCIAALLLAGCVGTQSPKLDQGQGAFDELAGRWAPTGRTVDEARGGDACARLTLGSAYSAIRTGIEAPVSARLENCGSRALELAPVGRCGRQYIEVQLSIAGYVWSLDREGGRARSALEPCTELRFPPRLLVPREAIGEEFVWAGYLAAEPCGTGGPRTGTVPAVAGNWHFESWVDVPGLGRLRAGLPLQIMDYQYEPHYRAAIWFWPEGNGSGRTLVDSLAFGAVGNATLRSQAEWAGFCGRFADGVPSKPLGWPFLDFQRERVEVEVRQPDQAACLAGPKGTSDTMAGISLPGGPFVCPWSHVRAVARPLVEPRSQF